MTDDYRELLEEAAAALYKLLERTEPGTGIALHHAYNSIKASIERRRGTPTAFGRVLDDYQRTLRDERAEGDERDRLWREQRARWKSITRPERERLVIQLIADGRLTVNELTERMQTELEGGHYPHEGDVRKVVSRLFAAGELDRVGELRADGRVRRFRYFRRTKLSGPIVDLDALFHDADPGE